MPGELYEKLMVAAESRDLKTFQVVFYLYLTISYLMLSRVLHYF